MVSSLRPNMPNMYRGDRGPSPFQIGQEENWCETCDRGFPSLDMLEKHKQQHQKCNIDGCQFIAHPKVITKHIQMQHSSGLYKKIANLKNPEEIEKWREERKRKYPTKENLEKKAAELKEKIERGEKMGLEKNKNKKFNNVENMKRKHPHRNEKFAKKRKCTKRYEDTDNNSRTVNNSKNCRKVEGICPPSQNNRKLKPFTGIQHLVMDNNSNNQEDVIQCTYSIEDDDDDACIPIIKPIETITKTETPSVCGALSSLICDYGSSEEETESKDEQLSNKYQLKAILEYKNNQNNHQDKKQDIMECLHKDNAINVSRDQENKPIEVNDNDNGAPEEAKFEKPVANLTDQDNMDIKSNNSKRHKTNIQTRRPTNKTKAKIPSTLLRKLLHREIQQERNIILQCIRHVVKNNFYDKK